MIFGTGLDIVEIDRIKNSLKKYSPKFEQKIFTSNEINYQWKYDRSSSGPKPDADRGVGSEAY